MKCNIASMNTVESVPCGAMCKIQESQARNRNKTMML